MPTRSSNRPHGTTARSLKRARKDEAYARFQRAECFGTLNQPEAQIEELNALVATGTQSTYLPEALYALGRAEIETNDIASAKAHLLELRSGTPNLSRANSHSLTSASSP